MIKYATNREIIRDWFNYPRTDGISKRGIKTVWDEENKRSVLYALPPGYEKGNCSEYIKSEYPVAVWYPDVRAGFVCGRGPSTKATNVASRVEGTARHLVECSRKAAGLPNATARWDALFELDSPMSIAIPPSTVYERCGFGSVLDSPARQFHCAQTDFLNSLRHIGRRADDKGRNMYGREETRTCYYVTSQYRKYIRYRKVYLLMHPDREAEVPQVPELWHTIVHTLKMLHDSTPKELAAVIRNMLKSDNA